MKRKKTAAMLAAILAASAAVTGCGDSASGGGDTLTVTYWIPRGEDTSLYAEYEDNPVMKYVEENYTFNGHKFHIDFYTAPPGSETDDFSTLLGTGDYCDILDMSMATTSAVEMYEDDMIWDLTELAEEHMPNYMAFMEENPDVKENAYSIIDGEKKMLQLIGADVKPGDNFEGYCYRRDWIAKYGKNPQTGEAFTYGFTDPDDTETWEDDVVFPSGGTEPLYISDWEWMFEIFEAAMDDLGIEDGYCYAPYYLGYQATGDLYSGFGGGAPGWWNDNGTCVYGITEDNFRVYLQCLNTWWNNGWIDSAFAEHTGDMFFAVDSAKVFQGKVGLWQGRISTVGNQIDAGDELTGGIVVYGCKQPINDIYGTDENKGKEPDMMYQFTKSGGGVCLTKKLTEEEAIAFMELVDFGYTEEGSLLLKVGLNKEQYEKSQDELYTRYGLTEGLYTAVEEADGTVKYHYNMNSSTTEFTAMFANRFAPARSHNADCVDDSKSVYVRDAISNWDYYLNTGALSNGVRNAVPVEKQQEITRISANLDQFLARCVAPMIKGSGYDVWDDASWQQFIADVSKYSPDTVTQYYQEAIDLVNQ